VLAALCALLAAGCGSSATPKRTKRRAHPAAVHRVLGLRVVRSLGSLPDARTASASALFGSNVVLSGGLTAADTSTSTVFLVGQNGVQEASSPLPTPVHDAAAATVDGRLLLFGGGQAVGTDQIVQVLPGPPRVIAALPQVLSDLVAASVGGGTYVLGGWNGSTPNSAIYLAQRDGTTTAVGELPVAVRYPAAGGLDGELLVAGGETAAGTPTASASAFDPKTGKVTPLPNLPVPTDHASGTAIANQFCVLGGLRSGVLTNAILCWTRGHSHWQSAGQLPTPLSDFNAVPFDGGIAVLGGTGSAGPVASITLLGTS
jgi:hypothetical protein